jgi:hypothetical protein
MRCKYKKCKLEANYGYQLGKSVRCSHHKNDYIAPFITKMSDILNTKKMRRHSPKWIRAIPKLLIRIPPDMLDDHENVRVQEFLEAQTQFATTLHDKYSTLLWTEGGISEDYMYLWWVAFIHSWFSIARNHMWYEAHYGKSFTIGRWLELPFRQFLKNGMYKLEFMRLVREFANEYITAPSDKTWPEPCWVENVETMQQFMCTPLDEGTDTFGARWARFMQISYNVWRVNRKEIIDKKVNSRFCNDVKSVIDGYLGELWDTIMPEVIAGSLYVRNERVDHVFNCKSEYVLRPMRPMYGPTELQLILARERRFRFFS